MIVIYEIQIIFTFIKVNHKVVLFKPIANPKVLSILLWNVGFYLTEGIYINSYRLHTLAFIWERQT